MPHVTTHYRVIVTAGHHRQPRNSQKWLEPYAASNVEAVPGTPMNPFAPPQLSYTVDGTTLTATFLFWSAGDGTDGQTTTDQMLNTTVGTAPLTLVAWYLPPGGIGNGQPGYIIDAFSDALNDFVDDDFVEVSPDASLTHDANVVGWVPTAHLEHLKAVPGSIHTGETFEQWIGGQPTADVDDLGANTSGYAIATYHNQHLSIPKIGDEYASFVKILYGIINDAPGAVLGPNGPVPVDPGWGQLLAAVLRSGGLVELGAGSAAAKEINRIALAQVNAAVKQFNAQVGKAIER
jgi:hypothetical protein